MSLPGPDTDELRAQRRRLTRDADDLARLFHERVLTEKGVRAESAKIEARLAQVKAQLDTSAAPTARAVPRRPGGPGRPAALGAAHMGRVADGTEARLVQALYRVRILPAPRGVSNAFNPEYIELTELDRLA